MAVEHRQTFGIPASAWHRWGWLGAFASTVCAMPSCGGEPFSAEKSRENITSFAGASGSYDRASAGTTSVGSHSAGSTGGSATAFGQDPVAGEGGATADASSNDTAGGALEASTGGSIESNAGAGTSAASGSAGAGPACLSHTDRGIQAAYFPVRK